MQWFRMYHDARTDGKLDFLDDASFRVWFRMMCFANEQKERGCIPRRSDMLMAVDVAKGDVDLYRSTIEVLKQLDIISEDDRYVRFTHWDKRQFKSDSSNDRVKRHRNKDSPDDCNGDVTLHDRYGNVTSSVKDLTDLQIYRVTDLKDQDLKTLVPSADADETRVVIQTEIHLNSDGARPEGGKTLGYAENSGERPDGAHLIADGKTKRSAEKSGYSAEFEKFWSFYPRKDDKKAAFEKWKARLRAGIPSGDLIRAAEHYCLYCEREETIRRYMMMPETFLGPKQKYLRFLDHVPDDGRTSRAQESSGLRLLREMSGREEINLDL